MSLSRGVCFPSSEEVLFALLLPERLPGLCGALSHPSRSSSIESEPLLDLRTWGWSLQPLLVPLPPFPLSQFPAGPRLAWRCRHRRSCYLGAHTPASTLRRPRATAASRIAGCASHPVSFGGHRPLSGQPRVPVNEAPPDCQLPLAPESG